MENPCIFLLAKEKTWKRMFNANSELSQNHTEKQIMKFITIVKGALMQIWKFHYMFVFLQKRYPENFAFLILRINELFTRKVCFFLKK